MSYRTARPNPQHPAGQENFLTRDEGRHHYIPAICGRAASRARALLGGILAFAAIGTAGAQAQTYTVLHTFNGAAGQYPSAYGHLVGDLAGNLYGATEFGGASGQGVVFKLDARGIETVLHNFTGGADGGQPFAGLTKDLAGNLYGVTTVGGASGFGVVFKLDTTGMETVLHNFTGGADGGEPYVALIRDLAGNLYGTTVAGGAFREGTVFRLDTTDTETVLHSFSLQAGGTAGPYGSLVGDTAGDLYGTTAFGGTLNWGVVFKIDKAGKETVLYNFAGSGNGDGEYPGGALVLDAAGNLYGTTQSGGLVGGVVFKVDQTGTETLLYRFTGGADGAYPIGGLVRDSAGNLYGTTTEGGASNQGVVFKLDPTGTETVLYNFTGGADGGNPQGGLLQDSAGTLFGTTNWGGSGFTGKGDGVVFMLKP